MIMHFNLGTNDLAKAETFYSRLLALFDAEIVIRTGTAIFFSFGEFGSRLGINKTFDGQPATHGNGSMVALLARSNEHVDQVYAKALALGGSSEGEPGSRRKGKIYAAYFRDLDGNKFGVIYPTGIE